MAAKGSKISYYKGGRQRGRSRVLFSHRPISLLALQPTNPHHIEVVVPVLVPFYYQGCRGMNHSVNSSPHGLKLQQRTFRLDAGSNSLMGTTEVMAACRGDSSWWCFSNSGQAIASGTALTSCSQKVGEKFVLPLG